MRKEYVILLVILEFVLMLMFADMVKVNSYYGGRKSERDERLTEKCKYSKVNDRSVPSYCYDYLK